MSNRGQCGECGVALEVGRDYGLCDSCQDDDELAAKPRTMTNVEFVTDMMEFSKHGPLAQCFIMDALAKYSKHVASFTPAELEKDGGWGMFSPQAWINVAKEIDAKMKARLG